MLTTWTSIAFADFTPWNGIQEDPVRAFITKCDHVGGDVWLDVACTMTTPGERLIAHCAGAILG